MDRQEIKKYFQNKNFIPSKKMGQNFLLNKSIQQEIISLANINSKTNVLEIGPGFGAITDYLVVKAKKVVAVELDKRLAEHLKNRINNKNFYLINDDILKIDLAETLDSYFHNEPVTVIGNLPYSISSLIVLKLMGINRIEKAIFMLQKEMADRIDAKPSTKDYNSLTVLIQWVYQTRRLLTVNQLNFYPVPKIESEVVEFIFRENRDFKNLEAFNKFLKLIFSAKRKKATNNLKGFYSLIKIHNFFDLKGINYNVRAEEISVENLYDLFHFLVMEEKNEN